MSFKITKKDKYSKARIGKLITRHGSVETPYFMAVATKATGKIIGSDDYEEIADGIICNALVLSLRPGVDVIKHFGTVHDFMNFHKPIFTDCGGFQILRESFINNTSKKGIHFRNPFNGQNFVITPKKIMDIEMSIGADCVMMLDDVAPYGANREKVEESLENTHRWAKECKKYHGDKNQMLYGIVQGGFFPDLRKKSAQFINSLDFDGIAIGGIAIGETREEMYIAVNSSMPFLDEEKPKHILGVGSPDDIVELVALGADSFDSVFPTQNARHGTLFTFNGKLDILKSLYTNDLSPIEKGCGCFVCKKYSRAYIRHLLKVNEPIGKRYCSVHNVFFMNELMRRIRKSIRNGDFEKLRKHIIKVYRRNFNVGVNVKQ
ncbi:MAG: tRNA guanosine(34) transglycosylase Tgt [Candidatus Woesearchaeota archaeon]